MKIEKWITICQDMSRYVKSNPVMKKVRSSEASISINSCNEQVDQSTVFVSESLRMENVFSIEKN